MSQAVFIDRGEPQLQRWGRYAVAAALLLLAVWAIWSLAHMEAGVKRQAPSISTLIPLEPPPPPPPPPVKPPEPKPTPQEVPQPTPPTPQPPAPTPQPQAPAQPTAGQNAITENAPAQAGSDAFNIGAGNGLGGRGSGTAGGGGGVGETAAMYGQYVRARIHQAVRNDNALRGKEFSTQVRVWFDAAGQVTRVEVDRRTAFDAQIKRLLTSMGGFRAPSAAVLAEMPIHFSIDERRPL